MLVAFVLKWVSLPHCRFQVQEFSTNKKIINHSAKEHLNGKRRIAAAFCSATSNVINYWADVCRDAENIPVYEDFDTIGN
jgi:hypothetical protein